MLADRTRFAGWVPPVDFDQGTPVPTSFAIQLAHELTPPYIANGFGKVRVFDHVLDRKVLHADHLVLKRDARAELLLIVVPAVGNASVQPGNLLAGLLPVLGAFLLASMPSLRLRQLLLVPPLVLGVGDLLPIARHHKRVETQIQPDHPGGDGKWFDGLPHQDGDEVSACAVFGNGDRTRLRAFGERAMPHDLERRVHLGERESMPIPGEGEGLVDGGLIEALLLEGGILRTPFEEVDVGAFQVAQRLLERHGGHLREKQVRCL